MFDFTQQELKNKLKSFLEYDDIKKSSDKVIIKKIENLIDSLTIDYISLTMNQKKSLVNIFLHGNDSFPVIEKLEEHLDISSQTVHALFEKHKCVDNIFRFASLIWRINEGSWYHGIQKEFYLDNTEKSITRTVYEILGNVLIYKKAYPTQKILDDVTRYKKNLAYYVEKIDIDNIAALEKNYCKYYYDIVKVNYVSYERIILEWKDKLNNELQDEKILIKKINEEFSGLLSLTEKDFSCDETKQLAISLYKKHKQVEFARLFEDRKITDSKRVEKVFIKTIFNTLMDEKFKQDSSYKLISKALHRMVEQYDSKWNFEKINQYIQDILKLSKKLEENYSQQQYENFMLFASEEALNSYAEFYENSLDMFRALLKKAGEDINENKSSNEIIGRCNGLYYFQGKLGVISIISCIPFSDHLAPSGRLKSTVLKIKYAADQQKVDVNSLSKLLNIEVPEVKNKIILLSKAKLANLIKWIEKDFCSIPTSFLQKFSVEILSGINTSNVSKDERNLMLRIFKALENDQEIKLFYQTLLEKENYHFIVEFANFFQDTKTKFAAEMYSVVIEKADNVELIEICKKQLLQSLNKLPREDITPVLVISLFARLPQNSDGSEMIARVYQTIQEGAKQIFIFENTLQQYPAAEFTKKIHQELFSLYNDIPKDKLSSDQIDEFKVYAFIHLMKSKNEILIKSMLTKHYQFSQSIQNQMLELADMSLDYKTIKKIVLLFKVIKQEHVYQEKKSKEDESQFKVIEEEQVYQEEKSQFNNQIVFLPPIPPSKKEHHDSDTDTSSNTMQKF